MRLKFVGWSSRLIVGVAALVLASIALMLTGWFKTDPVSVSAPKTFVELNTAGTNKPISTTPDFSGPPLALEAEVQPAARAPMSSWDKRRWIEKTARILRGGETIGPYDDIEYLESLSEEEIAREFMADSRFGDTVLDFSLYFLGFKADRLKVDGSYVFDAYDYGNAIKAAKAVLNEGDYLALFDLEGDYYLPPLSEAPTETEKSPEDEKLEPHLLRQKAAVELFSRIETLIELVNDPSPADLPEFCEEIEVLAEAQPEVAEQLYRAFTDEEIFVLTRASVPDFIFDGLQDLLDKDCAATPGNDQQLDQIEDKLWLMFNKLEKAFNELFEFEPAKYGPDTVKDLKPLNLANLPVDKPWPIFGYKQSAVLANSSTNFNRKRSAYVLKRFFCDDLTPVGFEMPKEHVGGTHGSQTSCFSCHFKLDPMAGFFRNYGADFSDMSASNEIVFDDASVIKRETYLQGWRGPESPEGTWDIGYIRSARWTDQNDYGSSLTDLSKIIRKAPEAKRCLMKRLTQYMLGENQTVDGAYLNALTADFEQEAKQNSSRALKNAMIRVLKSNAFVQRNPNVQKCYDFVPGTTDKNRPPCRIAYILEHNCVQCHGGDMALNQLDLTNWGVKPGGGASPNFTHLNADGGQIKAQDTLGEIIKRLTSNDLEMRMPKNMTMPNQERQELFLWVQNELVSRRAAE